MAETRVFYQPVRVNDDLTVYSDLAVSTGNLTVTTGNLTVAGTSTLTGAVAITGAVTGTQAMNDTIVAYSANGVIANTSHTAVITKTGSLAAMTIVANATNGIRITITSTTSFAHTITLTGGFWAGETGGPFNKITLAAFPGSSATIVSYGSIYYVVSDQIATVSN